MYKIRTYNALSSKGLDSFPAAGYEVSSDCEAPHGFMLRSHKLHTEAPVPSLSSASSAQVTYGPAFHEGPGRVPGRFQDMHPQTGRSFPPRSRVHVPKRIPLHARDLGVVASDAAYYPYLRNWLRVARS